MTKKKDSLYKGMDEKEYSSIQVTKKFKDELEKTKDKNHFDSYESTIKFLIGKG